ncbi:MAG: glycosyltransferase family 39 protein, partial [Anaerolineae bacterium]|nr:glycosyltransferase family 39 protein [Anaerolineae bacterium]
MQLQRFLTYRLALILLLAVALRLGIFFAFPATFAFDQTGAIHGSQAYDDYARNLLSTGVYGREPGAPDALIPPLYSYALAAVYGVFGRGSVQVALFHTVLDVLSITLLYHTGRRLFPRTAWIGALAALFYACYPYLIFQNLTLIDTPFFMLLLHAFVYGLVLLRGRERLDRGTWALAVGTGVVLGLSLLTRVLLPPLAALGALWFLFRLNLRQTLLRLLPVALVSGLVVLPWLVRNQAVYGVFVPGALNSGENFYQGNSEYTIPYFRAGYDVQWVPPQSLQASDPRSPEANAERFQWGVDYLRAHPEQIPDLLWVKFLVHWSIDVAPRLNPVEGKVPRLDYQGNVIAETGEGGGLELGGLPPGDPVGAYSQPLFDQIGRTVHRFYWGGLLLLGIIGAALSVRQWRDVSLLWFVQISMTLMYLIFHPSTRYRVPSDPLLFLFSAYALVWAWEWWMQRRHSAAGTTKTSTA